MFYMCFTWYEYEHGSQSSHRGMFPNMIYVLCKRATNLGVSAKLICWQLDGLACIASANPEVPYGRARPGPAKGPWKLAGVLMFSCSIWAVFLSILVQNGIKKPIIDQILGGGWEGACCKNSCCAKFMTCEMYAYWAICACVKYFARDRVRVRVIN